MRVESAGFPPAVQEEGGDGQKGEEGHAQQHQRNGPVVSGGRGDSRIADGIFDSQFCHRTVVIVVIRNLNGGLIVASLGCKAGGINGLIAAAGGGILVYRFGNRKSRRKSLRKSCRSLGGRA